MRKSMKPRSTPTTAPARRSVAFETSAVAPSANTQWRAWAVHWPPIPLQRLCLSSATVANPETPVIMPMSTTMSERRFMSEIDPGSVCLDEVEQLLGDVLRAREVALVALGQGDGAFLVHLPEPMLDLPGRP